MPAADTITIGHAIGADLPAVQVLMRRYVEWHYERHAAHRAMIDRYFDPVASAPSSTACPEPSRLLPAGCSSPVSEPRWRAASACATSEAASAR